VDLKLGKKPATEDARDITFRAIAPPSIVLPTPPARFGHGTLYKGDLWLMLGNGPDDTVAPGFAGAGDCVFAGAAHETMETNRLAGRRVPFTGAAVISDYSAVTGYVIGDDTTDLGTDPRDALKYRRSTGVVDANGVRHKIGAYVRLDPKDWDQLMQAVYVFAAVGIGFEFPASAMEQFDHGEPWDVVPGSPIEGGHYVPVMGRSGLNTGGVITWARRQVDDARVLRGVQRRVVGDDLPRRAPCRQDRTRHGPVAADASARGDLAPERRLASPDYYAMVIA
jgi:hypothetical protein